MRSLLVLFWLAVWHILVAESVYILLDAFIARIYYLICSVFTFFSEWVICLLFITLISVSFSVNVLVSNLLPLTYMHVNAFVIHLLADMLVLLLYFHLRVRCPSVISNKCVC